MTRSGFIALGSRAVVVALGFLFLIAVPSPARAQEPIEGQFYFAAERLPTHEVEQRGQAGSAGQAFASLILAPNADYRLWLVEASTLRVASVELRTPGNGQRFTVPDFFLRQPNPHDPDSDGAPTIVEWILDLDSSDPLSSGVGVPDGAAITQGLINLDALRTGIVASVDTPGDARRVCARDDMAVVADGPQGVSVFNVFNRMAPRLVARVATGFARDVACAGRRVAVADDAAGLRVIDVSDPPAARIVHTLSAALLGGNAYSVEAFAQIALVGLNTGGLVSVDLAGGLILDRVQLDAAVVAVTIAGDYAYALTASHTLHALPLTLGELEVVGSLQTPAAFGAQDLAVGDGVAYALHGRGYNTIDVSDPTQPTLIQTALNGLGWRGLALNGSGLALGTLGTVVDGQGNDLSVYDASDPAVVDGFQTTITTPGSAFGVEIFNGLGYVSDRDRGLHVVSYQPIDTGGIAPAVSISTSFGLEQLEEGTLARLTARVEDDRDAVRNVEWYLDDVRVATDGNWPFQHVFVAPTLSQQTTVTIRCRASDTGGNAVWSETLVIELTPDSSPPTLRAVRPSDGGVLAAAGSVAAFVDEPLDPQSLSGNLTLLEAGPDAVFGTGDDLPIAGALEFREDVLGVFLSFDPPLAPGRYQARLAAAVADEAGNPIGSNVVWSFVIYGTDGDDSDGDHLPDLIEELLGLDSQLADSDGNGTLDGDEDYDGDGLINRAEVFFGTDLTASDTDQDMISDADEDPDFDQAGFALEFSLGTSAFVADTDGDAFDDFNEWLGGSDPLDPTSVPLRNALTVNAVRNDTSPAAALGRELLGLSVRNDASPGGALGYEFMQASVQNQAAPDAVAGSTQAKVSSVRNDAP